LFSYPIDYIRKYINFGFNNSILLAMKITTS